MNEFHCHDCGAYSKTDAETLEVCSACDSDQLQQCCPMCSSIIDSDTKVCPECREVVA